MRGAFTLIVLFTATTWFLPRAAQADPFKKAAAAVRNTHRWLWGKKSPHPAAEPDVEVLAREIDWLEHLIESYGSVTPKHPDVWGEARLTRFRHEYEREIAKRFDSGLFSETLQGALRRSDQASLALALSINAASGNAAIPTSNAAVTLLNEAGAASPIQRTAPLPLDLKQFKAQEISLEPTVLNDQLSRYLEHLNELRRINEGADAADSAGYALYLVRLPVSVLPGHHTHKGFGAEITFTLAPYISDDLLPRTMRSLIINDISQILSIPLAQLFNNNPKLAGRFLTDYWTQQGQVRRWMQAYDNWLQWLETYRCVEVEVSDTANPATGGETETQEKQKDSADSEGAALPAAEQRSLISSRRLAPPQMRYARQAGNLSADRLRCISANDLDFLHSMRWYFQYRFMQILAQAKREEDEVLAREKWYAGRLPAQCESFPGPCETKKLFRVAFDFAQILPGHTISDLRPASKQLTATDMGANESNAAPSSKGDKAPNPNDGNAENGQPLERETGQKPATASNVFVLEISASQFAAFFRKLADGILAKPPDAGQRWKPEPAELWFDLAYSLDGRQYRRYRFSFPIKLGLRPDYQPDNILEFRALPLDIDDKKFLEQFNASELNLSKVQVLGGDPKEFAKLLGSLILDWVRSEFFKNYDNVVSNILNNSLDRSGTTSSLFEGAALSGASSGNAGAACTPLAPSQLFPTYGFDGFMDVALAAHWNLRSSPTNHGIVNVADIERFLQTEIQTAYDFLSQRKELWQFCTPMLAQAIRARDDLAIGKMRTAFMASVGGAVKHNATATLAWAIVVDAALINELLVKDIESVATAKGCECNVAQGLCFVGPQEMISPEAHEAFRRYVECRWPIIAFSLDPVTQDQNIADVFSRRRELQLAVAAAVATGNVSPAAAMNFARQTETDMETIALNRTSVGFSHDHDTIGWRFFPRFQSPDAPGNLVAFAQTLLGGPSRDCDLRNRELEPAERECTAVVVMPSFVNYMTVTSRANWFGLTNPRMKMLTMHDDMRISRTFQTVRTTPIGGPMAAYRPKDLEMLDKTMNQIERRLPLQEMTVEVPYENTLGGAELFCRGVRALAPRLDGWYGAPGVDPDGVTTLYLVGKRFSIHETRILAGGRYVPFRMLSRNVLEVEIPPGVQAVEGEGGGEGDRDRFVDVHAAAPWGVSGNHLLIPLAPKVEAPNHFFWATRAFRLELQYLGGAAPLANAVNVMTEPKIEIECSPPVKPLPAELSVSMTINEVGRAGELSLGTLIVNARLDLNSGRYGIDGDQFNVLSDALLKAANKRFGVKEPSPKERVHWLIRGTASLPDHLPEPIPSSVAFDVTFELKP